jgi:hypothetical protein
MEQQTAVEWLIETFKLTNVDISHHKLIIEQAKEMEKQQIQDAYRINPNNEIWSNSGIDYYNEKFENK